MKVAVATARKAAALVTLLAAVAMLALRRKGEGVQRPLAAAGYDLADGKGRVLMGRRLRVRPLFVSLGRTRELLTTLTRPPSVDSYAHS